MQRIGSFEQTSGAIVWRRGTDGCATVFGGATALFGLFWAAGGVAAVVRTAAPLGAVFALMGACMTLFGLAMATARSEVRIDRHEALIRRSAVVTLQSIRVPVQGCSGVAAVRNLVAVPGGPQRVDRRYAPTVSVGLLTPQGFVSLATELEDPQSDASVNAAVQSLCALTGLAPQDLRRSPSVLLAELAAFRRRAIVPILVATLAVVAVIGVVAALALSALDPGAARAPGVSDPAPATRVRGRRR